jgi:PIN domain nuclease of toxin-antitoxin system
MKLLIDTHVLLWWLDEPAQISDEAQSAIRTQENDVFVSAVTAWEIVIKKALGKLDAPDNLAEVISACRFLQLPMTIKHAVSLASLPAYHSDPFDRMLIAQAQVEELTILTRDSHILRYPVPHLIA